RRALVPRAARAAAGRVRDPAGQDHTLEERAAGVLARPRGEEEHRRPARPDPRLAAPVAARNRPRVLPPAELRRLDPPDGRVRGELLGRLVRARDREPELGEQVEDGAVAPGTGAEGGERLLGAL